MIELLLAAERILAAGDLDHAEHLFAQVAEADPRNAIAVVGLAEVAALRGDDARAIASARRALGIDPENAAARRMVDRLEAAATPAETSAATHPETRPQLPPAPPEPVSAAESEAVDAAQPEPAPVRRSWLHRLLGILGLRR